jgi:outer membrane phospholipase A
MALAIGFKRSLAGVVAVGALLSVTAANCEAKNTKTGPSFGSKKHNRIPVKLESGGTAFRQQIRYWIDANTNEKPTAIFDFDGYHWVHTIYLAPDQKVTLHVLNREAKEGHHVRCKITARKKERDNDANPLVASCFWLVEKDQP